MARAEAASLRVEVVHAPGPRRVERRALVLPAGSTVADALRASGLLEGTGGQADLGLSVWGRRVEPDALLRDLDRVELLRPLQVDPKEARRLRQRTQAPRRPAPRR